MATINKESIQQKISAAILTNRQAEALARATIQKKFDVEKRIMMGNFQQHPVTLEIDAGPTASNTSNTLGGVGNLFSFIGFKAGDDPISPVYDILHENTKLLPNIRKKHRLGNKIIQFFFGFTTPSKRDFEKNQALKYPDTWQGGVWTNGIEEGISGLQYYFFLLKNKFTNSRSGVAVQQQKPRRGGSFSPVSYLTGILNNFMDRLKNRTR